MRSFVMGLAASLAFAGAALAQPNTTPSKVPEVLRGSSSADTTHKKSPAKPFVQKASVAHSVTRPPAIVRGAPTQKNVRAARYGGVMIAPAERAPPPPRRATSSPRPPRPVTAHTGGGASSTPS